MVSNHQSFPSLFFSYPDRFVDTTEDAFTYDICLAFEFKTKYSITNIMKHRLIISINRRLSSKSLKVYLSLSPLNWHVSFDGRIVDKCFAVFNGIKGFNTIIQHFLNPRAYRKT